MLRTRRTGCPERQRARCCYRSLAFATFLRRLCDVVVVVFLCQQHYSKAVKPSSSNLQCIDERWLWNHGYKLTGTMSNNSPVHVFEPLFGTGQLLDNCRLKDGTIFHGSVFNADPHELQVMWRRVYNGCTRAICELKGIYNV